MSSDVCPSGSQSLLLFKSATANITSRLLTNCKKHAGKHSTLLLLRLVKSFSKWFVRDSVSNSLLGGGPFKLIISLIARDAWAITLDFSISSDFCSMFFSDEGFSSFHCIANLIFVSLQDVNLLGSTHLLPDQTLFSLKESKCKIGFQKTSFFGTVPFSFP